MRKPEDHHIFLWDLVRENKKSLNLVRLLLALAVIYRHSYVISGAQDLGFRPIIPGGVALNTFFGLSGLLVTVNSISKKNLTDYWLGRLVRLFPAYLFVLLFSVTLLLPIMYIIQNGSLSGYWNLNTDGPIAYFLNNLLLPIDMSWYVNNIFQSNPFPAINGSLWTMPIILRAYIFVALAIMLQNFIKFEKVIVINLLFISSFFGLQIVNSDLANNIFPDFILRAPNLYLSFCIGSFLAIALRNVKLNRPKLIFIFLLLCAVFVTSNFALKYFSGFFAILILIFLSLFKIEKFIFMNSDYSLGTYLFAFPIQESIELIVPDLNIGLFIMMSAITSVIFGMLSFKVIEQPSIKFYQFRVKKVQNQSKF